jgi:hypothetical protein
MSHSRMGDRRIGEIARSMGYVYDGITSKNHIRWKHPSGAFCITGNEASTWRVEKNAKRDLKHALNKVARPT